MNSSIDPETSLPEKFDYIITGAGCAGLSLAVHMIRSGRFTNKNVLLIDQDAKRSNDRTWCFWEKEPGIFEEVVFKKWDRIWFYDESFSSEIEIDPYQYKMIRGIDFYSYCLDVIGKQSSFHFLNASVEKVYEENGRARVLAGGRFYESDYVFNSIIFEKPQLSSREYWLLQHFKGWTIHTSQQSFDPHSATLMDFRISQQRGTAFCYVLPFSAHKALIEFTLFSKNLLHDNEYDAGLKHYIEYILGISDYTIEEQEFGVIPMTNYNFPAGSERIIQLGTAGGQTKGSSGYTFRFIQKHTAEIVRQISNGNPVVSRQNKRYRFYDSVLLNILHHHTLPGHRIFTDLFRRNKASRVLKFLDNETSIAEELKIISSLPTLPFLKAAIRQIF